MTAVIKGREVVISNLDNVEYSILKAYGSLLHWDRTRRAMVGTASVELIDKLEQQMPLTDELIAVRERLLAKKKLLDDLKAEEEPVPLTHYPVKVPLYKHQIRGANLACTQMKEPHTGYGFLFEMGTGKTLTAIATMGALYNDKLVNKVLIVAPTSVVGVWNKDTAEMADFRFKTALLVGSKQKRLAALDELAVYNYNDLPLQIAVINYESVWRDDIFKALLGWDADMIIADESQRIKTHSASQSKAMHRLGDKARYKLILSGTPVQNSAIDLYSQYRFMDSTVFGTNFFQFRNRYALMGGYGGHQVIGYRDMPDLIKRESSVSYRVTKAECLDLPEQTFENRYVILNDKDMRLYKTLKRESYAELSNEDSVTANTVLVKLLRLQQLTGGFLRMDDTDSVKQVNTAKLDALMEIIEDCADSKQKVVVFARFTAEIDAICEALKKKKIKFNAIDGRTPMEHKVDRATGRQIMSRAELVDDFQNNPETVVFLAQIQTAGLGITLHSAHIAVFYSLDFNYANYSQALARIHRIGQRNSCHYIHLVVEGSVDEDVLEAMKRKEDLAKLVVDGWKRLLA